MNVNTHKRFSLTQGLQSPPSRTPHKQETSETPKTFETVDISAAAKEKSKPGLSTLQAIGLGVGLTVAVGGAFVAGTHFQAEPEPPTVEMQMEDLGREFRRGFEDFKIDLRRAGEDIETGWNRGVEDAEYGHSQEREQQREFEDSVKDFKREAEDAKRDISRKASDLWRKLTN